jgi:hypothetical protein
MGYEFILQRQTTRGGDSEKLKEVATTKQVQSDQNPNLNEGS